MLFKQQPQAGPMREPVLTTQADLLSLCLGYSPSPTSNSPLPKSCPHTCLSAWAGKTPPQLGLQDKSEWGKGDAELTAVAGKFEGEQRTPPFRADHQPRKHSYSSGERLRNLSSQAALRKS